MDRGYAEADPSGDVDGWDAAVKAQILAGVVLGSPLPLSSVDRRGIAGITKRDVEDALARGHRIKLVAKACRTGGAVRASVAPEEIPLSHPLAGVSGATNAITFTTDTLGDVTIIGPGAGREETGQALLSDMLAIAAGARKEDKNLIKQSVFH
jgi:homoserine dehydrogenase